MPKLKNPRWEEFAKQKAIGQKNADAYFAAGFEVNGKKGSARRRTASNRACRLTREHPEIDARIEELTTKAREDAIERSTLDRNYVLDKLKANIERASQAIPVLDRDGRETGEYKFDGAVVNRGSELLGKELGMFADRTLIGSLDGELEGMTNEQLRAYVRSLCNEIGLRMVDMDEEQTREWIVANAPKVGLKVVYDEPTPKPKPEPPALH